jgi:DNA-binding SARP family transcriptional activator
VLALLLLHANEVVSSDRLIDALWGESPPESAANMLQGYVSRLRKTLEPENRRGEHERLVSRPPGYVLHVRADQLDAERFERLAREGRLLLEDGNVSAAADRLRAALSLWRGGALADLAYEAFARADIDRLEELRLETLEDRIDAELALGRHQPLVAELRELVEQHPLRERLRAQLMIALFRSGRQAEALETYREGRRLLLDELGIEPGIALRELEHAILRQDPALGAPSVAPPAIAGRHGRRWPVVAVCIVAAAAVSAAVLTTRGHSNVRPVATDLLAGDNGELWSANGGSPGHTPFGVGNGTVAVWHPGPTVRPFRVGPNVLGDEEQTTLAADSPGSASVWVGNKDSRTVRQLDRATGQVLLAIHGVTPGGLAAIGDSSAGDTVWASDPNRNLLVRIDEHQKRIVRRIHIPNRPARVAAEGDAVWVISRDEGPGAAQPTRLTKPALWHIDPRTNKRVARIGLPLTPIRVVLGAGSVWVSAQRVLSARGTSIDATVFRIDPATNRIVARIPLRTQAVDGILVSHGAVWAAIPASQ